MLWMLQQTIRNQLCSFCCIPFKYLPRAYSFLTLVKVHPSLKSDLITPSGLHRQKSFKSVPAWLHLSGPRVAFAPFPCLPVAMASLSLPSLTKRIPPQSVCFPAPEDRQTGCWPFLKLFSGGDACLLGVVESIITPPDPGSLSSPQDCLPSLEEIMGGWLMLTAGLVATPGVQEVVRAREDASQVSCGPQLGKPELSEKTDFRRSHI